jgi:hypothetical protein
LLLLLLLYQLRYFASLGRDVDAWRKCRNASGVAFL